MEIRNSELFSMFNKIYESSYDEKGFNVDDKPEFRRVYETLKRYGMPTELFEKNLKTMSLVRCKLGQNQKACYLPRHNKLEYSDIYYIIHELFHVAHTKNENETSVVLRIGDKLVGGALKEGITDMFSSLCDPNYEVIYPFEKLCAEAIVYIGGFEAIKPHFEAKPMSFLNSFGDSKEVLEFMSNLDKYQSSIESVIDSISNGEYAPDNFGDVYFYFDKCLSFLANLFYLKKGVNVSEEEKQAFLMFIKNGLNDESMKDVMMIVTRFGTQEYAVHNNLFNDRKFVA